MNAAFTDDKTSNRKMTTRRFFLRTGALSLVGMTYEIARATPVTPPASTTTPHGYALTNGATALKRDDGAWLFWVRLINRDDPNSDISASLQLATDKGFTQIIDVLPITLSRTKSFIAQTVYTPKSSNALLYYRYIVGAGPAVAPSVSLSINSIAPWNTESKAE